MDSKQAILAKLKRQIVDQTPLPDVRQESWIRYDDPLAQFRQVTEMVGGKCHMIESATEIPERMRQFPEWQQAQRIFSAVPEIAGNVDLQSVEDPHELENVDFVVYPGEFGVAENGAIWVSDHDLKHRVIFFITQYLVLVVRKESVVHNMHEAYPQAEIPRPGFGLFLSGPSKTADIEQSLVIGAHGCKELQVFLL